MSSVPSLPTVGEIARRLSAPLHKVEYVLRSREVQPAGRAGNALVYSDADVAFVASELRRIEEERQSSRCFLACDAASTGRKPRFSREHGKHRQAAAKPTWIQGLRFRKQADDGRPSRIRSGHQRLTVIVVDQ